MLKTVSVIYFPGIGGNFIKLCLSLSRETVPYYYTHLDSCTHDQLINIQNMTAEQRREIICYSTVDDYKKIHNFKLAEPDFYYQSKLINDYFSWSIVANHPDNYLPRLEYLTKIVYVELDVERYGHWVKNSCNYFRKFCSFGNFNQNNNYQLTTEQQLQENQLKSYTNTTVVSMSNVLTGLDGFVSEYLHTCNSLQITPEVDHATLYYNNWRKLRVDPFI